MSYGVGEEVIFRAGQSGMVRIGKISDAYISDLTLKRVYEIRRDDEEGFYHAAESDIISGSRSAAVVMDDRESYERIMPGILEAHYSGKIRELTTTFHVDSYQIDITIDGVKKRAGEWLTDFREWRPEGERT